MGLRWHSHFSFGLRMLSYFLLNYEHDSKALDSLFSLMTINSPNTRQALVIMPWLFRPEPSLLFLTFALLHTLSPLPGGPSFIWFTWGAPFPPFKTHLGPTFNVLFFSCSLQAVLGPPLCSYSSLHNLFFLFAISWRVGSGSWAPLTLPSKINLYRLKASQAYWRQRR